MKKVIIPRGIPGSGKSTWVKAQLATHAPGTAVRISNDDLSFMLYSQPWGTFFFSDITKETLHKLRLSMLDTFLSQDGITHVYVDNTNLAVQTVKSLQDVAIKYNAEFIVNDDFLNVSIDECVDRDSKRDAPVGADVIRKMASAVHKIKPWVSPSLPTIEKYDNTQGYLGDAIIVDIDGTLAHMNDRSPYDWNRVDEDSCDESVRHLVNMMSKTNHVIIMSGRDGSSMDKTLAWLDNEDIRFDEILMREAGDMRPDWIVKNELFQRHVAGTYRIRFVLDDRDQVVHLWRDRLGLPTYQVAAGNF